MKTQHLRIMLAVALVAAAGVGSLVMREPFEEFWNIDACLDAGGAWNYADKICDPLEPPDEQDESVRRALRAGDYWTGGEYSPAVRDQVPPAMR
jgi:hypothetical protein